MVNAMEGGMRALCCGVEDSVNRSALAESLAVSAARLADALEQDVRNFLAASDQNLGDIEVQIEQQSRELLRVAAEKAAQKKADLTPPVCPVCQQALSRMSADHGRSFECKFGTITIVRSRGYCKRCRKWRFPADTALGLEETAGYSPRVQEMAALLASKMPVSEASAVLEHLTGVKLPRATLDREARRQGERLKRCKKKLIIFRNIKTGWITGRDGGEANPSAAGPSSRLAGRRNVAPTALEFCCT